MTTTDRREGLVERAATWLFGTGQPAAGYRVSTATMPGGVRDTDLPVERVYAVLDEAFNGYFDAAVDSLANVEVPDRARGEHAEVDR